MFKQVTIESQRLQMRKICLKDQRFILELLNSRGWQNFIGDRNVNTLEQSREYIKKIQSTTKTIYWIVVDLSLNIPIGVVTLVKDSLYPYSHFGFAFLPQFQKQGYAFEASRSILDHLSKFAQFETLLAITMPNNFNSVNLLEKLGFSFSGLTPNQTQSLAQFKVKLA